MTSIILYSLALVLLLVSFIKDKVKTKKALKIAFTSFENIMPQFLSVIVFVGIVTIGIIIIGYLFNNFYFLFV